MAGDAVLIFTDDNFKKDAISGDLPVMVDFWAPWCGPCQMAGPVIDELAVEMKGKVKIGKLNVDDNQKIAGEHGVMSIPTVILFKDGKEIDRKVGFAGKKMYEDLLAKA